MVSEGFLELLTKELSGEISAEERAELDGYLNRHSAFKEQYKAIKGYWVTSNQHTYVDDTLAFEKIKLRIQHTEDAGRN